MPKQKKQTEIVDSVTIVSSDACMLRGGKCQGWKKIGDCNSPAMHAYIGIGMCCKHWALARKALARQEKE